MDESVFVESGISDEELTALALAADPDVPLDPDAQPSSFFTHRELLPTWYMPAAAGSVGPIGRGRAILAWLLIAGFLTITAFGSCATYGQLIP